MALTDPQARKVHSDQLTVKPKSLHPQMWLKLAVLTKQRKSRWKIAGGWRAMKESPEAWRPCPPPTQISAVSKLLLNVVVFSNLFIQKKVISNSMSSWWWHTDLYQNFQLDLLKPEKVKGTESQSLTTLELRLLGPLLFANHSHYLLNTVVHQTKFLVLHWRTQRSNAISHLMSAIIKFRWNKMHWESKKLYFM